MNENIDSLIADASSMLWSEKDAEELNELIQKQINIEEQLDKIKVAEKNLKQALYEVQEVSLPDKLNSLNINSFTYKHMTVTVQSYYSARIKPEYEEKAFEWLEDNNHTDLIKNDINLTFKKGEDEEANEAFDLLLKHDFDPSRKSYVHHSTLKAFVREQIENQTPNFPLETFGVYVGQRSIIKGDKQ